METKTFHQTFGRHSVRIATNNESQWETLYETLMPRVYNFFRYRLGDDQAAQDLTSCTFERAWRYRANYHGDSAAFSSWLYTIARNVASDHRSRDLAEVPLETANTTADSAESGDTDRILQTQRLFRFLDRLSERERDLVALKYGCELSNREIAEITGLGESNVGTILHRAILSLRCQWEA